MSIKACAMNFGGVEVALVRSRMPCATSSGSGSTRDVRTGSGSEGQDRTERSPMKPEG